MTNRSEIEKRNKKTRELSEKFVFTILVYSITIENHLTMIIASEFTKDRGKTHFIKYFDKSTFERKIDLVEIILKVKYLNVFQEHKKTISQIRQIKDIRNKIAHYTRSFVDNQKQTKFVLSPTITKVKQDKKGLWVGIDVKEYSVKEMKGLMKMVEECDSNVRKLVETLVVSKRP